MTVKVMTSPTSGVASLTDFVRRRSACWGVSVALAVLLAVLGSSWSLSLIVAVLVCAAGLTTVAVRVRVAVPPPATAPTTHTPVPGV